MFYFSYLNCGYLITSSISGYSSVQIQIDDIYIETSYDFLYIYDGLSSSYTNLAASNLSSGSSYRSSGSSVFILFTTDSSVTRRGFSLSYRAVQEDIPNCASLYTQYQASTSTRSIQSPNYPSNYNSYIETYWLIVKPDIDDTLVYYFVSFRLESDTGCDDYDYLVVYNGACTTSSVIARYCGYEDDRKHTHSKGKYILFKMKTDSSANYRGFQMNYVIDSTDDSETEVNVGVIAGASTGSFIALVIVGCILFSIISKKARGKVSTTVTGNKTTKATLPSIHNKHDLVITPKTPKPKSQTNRITSNYSAPQDPKVPIIPYQGPPAPYPPSSIAAYPPISDPAYPPLQTQGPNNQLYMSYGRTSAYPDPSVPNPFEYNPGNG